MPGFFGSRSGGKAACSWPISALRELAPHSKTSASSAVMIAGRPQPSRSIGPATCLSRAGGKTVRSAASSRPAFATGSFGKRIASSVWLRRPARSASVSSARRRPKSPPIAESESGPSCSGGSSSSERMIRNE